MVAHFVDDEKIEDLHKMFTTMDKDNNGTLEVSEIKEGLMQFGLTDLATDFETTIDIHGSGMVDYYVFSNSQLEWIFLTLTFWFFLMLF